MISLDDVSVSRGDLRVLSDLSVSIAEGEFVGLVGPNGAGKTTLLQVINGVLTPDSGTVTVGGVAVESASAREVSRLVATVPQEATVGFEFDVADIVAMGRTPYTERFGRPDYREDRRHVEQALARTETQQFADRSIREVSGGERQRVLLARALAQDTPALVLDEPTASLDINHQVQTLELVADLVAEGKTAVAAIHDLDLAARFCDRLVLLSQGRILASGPPESVLEAGTLGDAFETDAAVATDPVTATPSVTAMTDTPERDTRVHVVGSGSAGARVLARLDEAGFTTSVGPLPSGDVAGETSRARGIETVTVPAFGRIDESTEAELAEFLTTADVTVLANPPLDTDGIVANAVSSADAVVLVEQDLPRHHTDRVRAQFEDLRSHAVTTDEADLLATILQTTVERELPADD